MRASGLKESRPRGGAQAAAMLAQRGAGLSPAEAQVLARRRAPEGALGAEPSPPLYSSNYANPLSNEDELEVPETLEKSGTSLSYPAVFCTPRGSQE
eukprot:3413064-Pyramimonas_sp.AAC.1